MNHPSLTQLQTLANVILPFVSLPAADEQVFRFQGANVHIVRFVGSEKAVIRTVDGSKSLRNATAQPRSMLTVDWVALSVVAHARERLDVPVFVA